ncbi:MAG: alpha/beta hydrolase [Ruminococcus sp.]|nr:alpha/beta hydrolase [Ruminococcus sp.]
MKKLCVLFPGIGYNCDKPLLYYTGKMFKKAGYDVIRLSYSGFPEGAKGNDEKMRLCAEHAYEQSVGQLRLAGLDKYDRVVFVGKSIGTVVCARLRQEVCPEAVCIFMTPLEVTFSFGAGVCAFTGTADPWAETEKIKDLCGRTGTPLKIYEGADHSLETGDTENDLAQLLDVLREVKHYI